MSIRNGYVDTRIGQLHYRTAGVKGPAIVLLHQTASSSRMYESLMNLLGDTYRLVAFDTPGFGNSAAFCRPPSVLDFSEILHEATAALSLADIHLIGHHTGAAIATQWAADHPKEVSSLIMIGALGMGGEERRRWLSETAEVPRLADGGHLTAAWNHVARIDRQPAVFPPTPELQHREALDMLLATPRWHEAYRAVFTHDYEAALARVKCPVLLICGEEDILRPYFEATTRLKADIQSFTLEGGAYILDQAINRVAPVMQEFLSATMGSQPK